MKTFETRNFRIECTWHNQRDGFRHSVKLFDQHTGDYLGKHVSTYCNRTWEAFEYETAMSHLLGETDAMNAGQKRYFRKKFNIGS